MLLAPRLIEQLTLRPADFYWYPHQVLCRHMWFIKDRGGVPDHVLLRESLAAHGELKDVGGLGYLAELLTVPTAAHFAYYQAKVAEYARRRQMLQTGIALIQKAHDLGSDV